MHLFKILVSNKLIISLTTLLLTPSSYALIVGDNVGNNTDSPTLHIDQNSCDSPWVGAVSLEINQGIYSGVVIGKRWVLTAAHVAKGAQNTPQNIHIFVPCNETERRGERVFIHPQYQQTTMQSIPLYDLALIRISEPLPVTMPIPSVNFEMIEQSTEAILLGYGASGNAGDKQLLAASKRIKLKGKNSLDTILIDDQSRLLAYQYDFDGPDQSSNYLGGLTLGNRRETEVAPGDSGGPLFVMTNQNQPVLVGINTFRMSFSRGTFQQAPAPPDFGSGGGGVFLNGAADWLLRLVPDLTVNKTAIRADSQPTKSPHQ